MLPFGVDGIEPSRAHKKNAAKLYPPHFPLATNLPFKRKFATANRQIPDPLLDRFSGRDSANVSAQNMGCLKQKNETVLAKWVPTFNRFWVKNRCYTKQTTKPCLTGTRTRIRLSLNFTKFAQDFAAFESQNSELSLWNPLWNPLKKTGGLISESFPTAYLSTAEFAQEIGWEAWTRTRISRSRICCTANCTTSQHAGEQKKGAVGTTLNYFTGPKPLRQPSIPRRPTAVLRRITRRHRDQLLVANAKQPPAPVNALRKKAPRPNHKRKHIAHRQQRHLPQHQPITHPAESRGGCHRHPNQQRHSGIGGSCPP